MVGTNPYFVVSPRRRSGRCTVCPCCLLPVPSAVCARARAAVSPVRACCRVAIACVLLRWPCVRACVLRRPCAVRPSVRARVLQPWSPTARFLDFGRLHPGGGKQWSAPTPTMLWRCPVGPAGRLGRPRSVSSISDVYTQEVGNNGRHQPLLCCGVAISGRSVHGLSVLCVLPLPCAVCACVRAAASPVRAAGSAVRGRAPLSRPCCACCCCWNPIDSPRWSLPVRSGRLCPPPFDPSSFFRQPLRRRRSKSGVWSGVRPCRGGMCAVIGRVANGGPLLRRAAAPCIAPSPSPLGPAALAAPRFECLYSYRFCGRRPLR